jgi:putative PIN family toxin of toxin-antitoxin system
MRTVTSVEAQNHFGELLDAAQREPVTIDEEDALMPACRDPRDNRFLALAWHCSANLLISSDDDLLVLNPWKNIKILTPAQFIQ